MEGSGSPGGTPNDEKRDDNTDSRHINSVLLWKIVGYAPSSFADLVFARERVEADLKRGRFNHPAWTNEKTRANEEGEDEVEAHAVTAIPIWPSFPPTQQCHYSASNNPSPYPPHSYPQRPSLNHTTKPTYHTTNAKTPLLA